MLRTTPPCSTRPTGAGHTRRTELAAQHGVWGTTLGRLWSLKIEVTGLGDYTCNVGHKTGLITYEFETKMFFNYSRGIKLLADVMDVEGGGCSALMSG